MDRRLPLVSRKPMKRSVPLNKVGRRTKLWRAAWRRLKPELEKRGRTSCEYKFIPHVCFGPLDPAHSKKRRKMVGDDISVVALACRRIHDYLDRECSHEEMEALVLKAIDLAMEAKAA